MEIDVKFDGLIRLRNVVKPVVFENEEGEQIRVRIINGGFEVSHKNEVMVIEKVEDCNG